MSEYDKYFQIGIVVKAQGVKGELRVLPTTDDPERFGLLKTVTVFQKEHVKYEIQSSRLQKNMVILKFKDIDDRDAAGLLTNAQILIPPEEALPLEENEYYLRDLIGMDVFTEDGENLGRLNDVLVTGANDVYVVGRPREKEILIPAIKECIKNIDVAGKKMIVRLLDGLRDDV